MAINGLSVTISGERVQKFCLERAAERRQRADIYEQQIKTLGDADIDMGTASNDIKSRAREGAKSCIQQAEEMEFLAQYIDLHEQFILTQYDLQRLGIVK
jgi:hypothetical protein